MANRNVMARLREVRAVELMTAGATYQQVADELGYRSRAGAWHAVQRALDRRVVEAVDLYRLVELENLDRLQTTAWRRANAGDVDAVGKVIAIIQARCRILGLYDVTSQSATAPDEGPDPTRPIPWTAPGPIGGEGDADFADGLARLYGSAPT